VSKRLSLSNQHVLILGSDDRRRHGYRRSVLEPGRRRLPAAAAGAQATEDVETKHADERVAELFAHRAVENEIDSVVDERQDVQQVADRHVDFDNEARQNAAQQVDDAIRELCHQKQDDDQQQHHRRAVRLAIGAASSSVLARLRHRRTPATQVLSTLFRLLHRLDEQQTQHRQPDARHQANKDRLHSTSTPHTSTNFNEKTRKTVTRGCTDHFATGVSYL